MERPGERITLARPAPGTSKPSTPSGLLPAALQELRSAAATYDYLRSTGDPTEFWETLRLARSHRGLPAHENAEVALPGEQEDAAIRQALDGVRERFCELVGELRAFLEETSDLPQPAERLEMAIAFLMASSREHDFVSQWLREPDKSRGKAADKLRSLAAITDPYREALRPWSLD